MNAEKNDLQSSPDDGMARARISPAILRVIFRNVTWAVRHSIEFMPGAVGRSHLAADGIIFLYCGTVSIRRAVGKLWRSGMKEICTGNLWTGVETDCLTSGHRLNKMLDGRKHHTLYAVM